MQSREELERTLDLWGKQLLCPGLRRYGRPGKDPRIRRQAPLGGATLRAGLRAIVRRAPEVMVKVTGGGRGMGAIKAHMAYISRRGELALENELGQHIQGREELAGVAEEWQLGGGLIPTFSHRREAFHVMLSMPPETDAQAVLGAAREFAREEFSLHKFAFVLHDPATDPDSHRPHVHLIVRAQGRDGRRLNPRKADLARWRQAFADRLVERGVAASATRRQTRGVLQPAKTLLDHHVGAIERKAWALRQGEDARQTEDRVLIAWKHIATALLKSEEADDRTLGREALRFVAGMQTVARRMHQQHQIELFKNELSSGRTRLPRGQSSLTRSGKPRDLSRER